MRLLVCSIGIAFACAGVHAADAPPASPAAMFGTWKFDSALSGYGTADDTAASTDDTHPANAAHAHGGGRHGGGGMGGGHGGGGGGRHGGTHAAAAQAASGGSDAEKRERGLARLFTMQLTIGAASQRIRFDDGEHAVELDKDGMNLSGGGVGGTVALTAIQPELVLETLTDSGYTVKEHYRLSDDGEHLELHASLKKPGADQAHEILRVFDRVKPAADKNAAPAQSPAQP